jgi:pyridoxal 5'-phosphate synthase pdxS subunit
MKMEELRHGTNLIKRGFVKMQKGGVIMDVTNAEQALIAEKAGAVAVMALQAVPADIRKEGGVARMADPAIVEKIINTVTIPVMAKARIGHFVEAEGKDMGALSAGFGFTCGHAIGGYHPCRWNNGNNQRYNTR